MLETEIYKDNRQKLANDILFAMVGANDTSRNATTTALIYFMKQSN